MARPAPADGSSSRSAKARSAAAPGGEAVAAAGRTVVSCRAGELLRVELSDGSTVVSRPCYLAGCDAAAWEAGRGLLSGDEEALRFAAGCFRAERAGMRLIARAEQTSAGIARKLARRGYERAWVEAAIARFVDTGLVDDGRYAELWLRSRLRRGEPAGPRALAAELARRGLDRGALERVLDEDAEWDLLRDYAEKEGGDRRILRAAGFSSAAVDRYCDAPRAADP